MKKKTRDFFADRRVVLVVALLVAFFSWVVIAGFIDPDNTRVLDDVTIDYERGAETYRAANLQIVGGIRDRFAEVRVKGDGAVTGPLNNTSVSVYVDYGTVDGPGVYELPLRVVKNTDGNYNIGEYSVKNSSHSLARDPKTRVTLTFEEVETKQFTPVLRADGITAAEGYFRDTATLVPATVSVTGPKPEVERIAQVVAEIASEDELVERKRYLGIPLTLLDSAGEVLDPEELGLTLSAEVVDVEIPIYEIHTVQLAVSFTGLPDYFDDEWFENRIELSDDHLQVVGPTAALEQMGNPYVVAYYNVSQLELNWESDPINISVPDGVRNYDQLRQITVRFDSTGLVEKTFAVQSENIRVVNGPRNAEITPVADQISVRLIGPEEQINALLPEDIIVQVDAFDTPARAGQQTLPARILAPSANQSFAIGEYSLTCDVVVES